MTPLTRAALSLVALLAAVACSGDPTGNGGPSNPPPTEPPAPEPAISIASITGLTPGGTATLTGSGLDQIETLLVDGETVSFAPSSTTEGSFVVPTIRACETDGRSIEVVASGAGESVEHTGRLEISGTVRMNVGESRVLTAEDLGCLQFAAGDEDYVLTALNTRSFARDEILLNEDVRSMLRVRSWTDGADAPIHLPHRPSFSRSGSGAQPRRTISASTAPYQQENPPPHTGNPVLFDPGYANPQVGDTLRFVNWNNIFGYVGYLREEAGYTGNSCDIDQSVIPDSLTYQGERFELIRYTEVAAVEGKTVIVVDLGSTDAAEHLTPKGREWLAAGARLADQYQIAAAQEVYGQQFQPLAGADGRHFVIVTDLNSAGSGEGGTWQSEAKCALASEVMTTLMGNQTINRTELMVRNAASIIIHELAHLAARTAHPTRPFNGMLEEAFATATEGVAYRLATGQSMGALLGEESAPLITAGLQASYGRLPEHSAFVGVGGYTRAAVIVHYARELSGDAPIGAESTNLYQRYHNSSPPDPNDPWAVLGHLASLLGRSAMELLDEAMLADATDDLITPEAAAAAGLPQLLTWTRPGAREGVIYQRGLSRTTNQEAILAAASGSYAALYLMADEENRGISVTLEEVDLEETIVRLTRVR